MLTVVFQVHEERYGIRSENILEVIPQVRLRVTPRSPDWLLGMFVYRGALTPVIDLCQLIGGYPCSARLSSRIILAHGSRADGTMQMVGFFAERVTEARRLSEPRIATTGFGHARRFGEVVLVDSELLHLLDVDALIAEVSRTSEHLVAAGEITSGETDRDNPQP
jgi:chemotaxis-related protein WspB